MKIVFVSLIFLLCNSVLDAQHIAIAADKMNICYLGLDNPLTIVAENCSCKQIVLEIDNGIISGKECKYVYRPEHLGRVRIKALKKNGKKLTEISKWEFRIKQIPDPVFKVGPYGNGAHINATILNSQKFSRADLEGFDFEAKFKVDSFRITIKSKDSIVKFTCLNQGNRFGAEVYNGYLKLEIGDILIYDKINVHGPDNAKREINPVRFSVMQLGQIMGPFQEDILCW